MEIQNIVIIGGGQAAAYGANTLRAQGYEGRLFVVSDEEKVFYERPPLSKEVLAGKQDPKELHFFSEEQIEAMNIDWHKPDRATKIDRINKMVTLESGTILPYDKLLLATGSRPRVPVPAWCEVPHVHTLRTIEDSANLSGYLHEGSKLAIIGGGWIGLEVAATANQAGLEVEVFELAPRLCQRSVTEEVSDYLYKMHEAKGTKIHLNCGPIDIEERDGKPVLIVDGKEFPADAVVVGAGAEIATELASDADLDVDVGVVVDGTGQTSDPDIFAAGDVAIHPVVGFCTQSWANAQQQATIAAKHMLGIEDAEEYAEAPWIWSDQYNFNIQILGYPVDDECELIVRETSPEQVSFIHLDKEGKLRSVVAINDARLIAAGRRWIRAEMSLPAEDLANPEFNVMSLRPPRK